MDVLHLGNGDRAVRRNPGETQAREVVADVDRLGPGVPGREIGRGRRMLQIVAYQDGIVDPGVVRRIRVRRELERLHFPGIGGVALHEGSVGSAVVVPIQVHRHVHADGDGAVGRIDAMTRREDADPLIGGPLGRGQKHRAAARNALVALEIDAHAALDPYVVRGQLGVGRDEIRGVETAILRGVRQRRQGQARERAQTKTQGQPQPQVPGQSRIGSKTRVPLRFVHGKVPLFDPRRIHG